MRSIIRVCTQAYPEGRKTSAGTSCDVPTHGWRYDVTTGHTRHDPEERVTRDPVQVVEGRFWET